MDATTKSACKKVSFLIALALLCCGAIYHWLGQQAAAEFLGAYLIEFSLSIDNLFVFITVFTAFQIPVAYQHRVLAWGIWTAVILRFVFIFLGVTIVERFSWILYLFGVILLFSAYRMFQKNESEKPVTDNFAYSILKKWIPISETFDGNRFLTKQNGRWHATPLLAAFLVIEGSDILFAIDSVPAAFSVSTNLFLVYTSNILAILGLRQLYFLLEHLQERFQYVRYGVAIILGFTGIKLLAVMLQIHISIAVSIGFILLILLGSILLSIYKTAHKSAAVPVRKKEIGEE